MAIKASKAEVVSATEEKTYDQWVTTRIALPGTGITEPLRAVVNLVRARKTPDDQWDLSTDPGHTVTIEVNDVWAKAAEDGDWLNAITAITDLIVKEGTAQGKL